MRVFVFTNLFFNMINSLIFSAPSGAGKTTIVNYVLNNYPNVKFSISATTRSPRKGEVDGVDYHFISVDRFKELIELGWFLEWEEVYTDQFYGTLIADVGQTWDDGNIVIFDLDVIGGINLKKILGDKCISFFVKPPSIEELESRLRGRGSDSEESIQKRLSKSIQELEYENGFDKVIVNSDLEEALAFVDNELRYLK